MLLYWLNSYAIIFSVGKTHIPTDHVLELLKQVFGFRCPVVFTVGHKVIQTFVPRLDVLAGGPFDQDDDLQGDLEKQAKSEIEKIPVFL